MSSARSGSSISVALSPRAGFTEVHWLSFHISFNGALYGPAGDGVIRDLQKKLLTLDGNSFQDRFWIRYGSPGPHIRMRVCGEPDQLLGLLVPAVQEMFPVIDEDGASSVPRPLTWVRYEPEVERYGGPEGIPIAEEMFVRSSDYAESVLNESEVQPETRMAAGLLSVVLGGFGLTPVGEDPRRVFEILSSRNTSHARRDKRLSSRTMDELVSNNSKRAGVALRQVASALSAGDRPEGHHGIYLDSLVRGREQLKALGDTRGTPPSLSVPWYCRFIFSVMHMTCNRLGVAVADERLLYSTAAAVFAEWTGSHHE